MAWFDDVAVPIDRLDAFWVALTDALRLEGSVYVIDSAHDPTSTAVNHLLPDAVARVATQKLDDGSTYRIVKHFWAPSRLTQALANIGWRANLRQTRRYFIYGAAVRE